MAKIKFWSFLLRDKVGQFEFVPEKKLTTENSAVYISAYQVIIPKAILPTHWNHQITFNSEDEQDKKTAFGAPTKNCYHSFSVFVLLTSSESLIFWTGILQTMYADEATLCFKFLLSYIWKFWLWYKNWEIIEKFNT